MIILDCIQLSNEWFQSRCGIPTASHFDKIVTSKGEPSKQAEKYLYQLAGERITGVKEETYQNATMLRGTEMEEEARNLFQMIHDVEVWQVGLVYPDEKKLFSCSPDGLMGDTGLEIKCPLIHTHVGYLLAGKLPTDYIQQVQGSMLITEFKAWYFMSYYPGLPPLIIKVERDMEFLIKLKVELEAFCEELDRVEDKLRRLG